MDSLAMHPNSVLERKTGWPMQPKMSCACLTLERNKKLRTMEYSRQGPQRTPQGILVRGRTSDEPQPTQCGAYRANLHNLGDSLRLCPPNLTRGGGQT
eukprot:SAG31_NODE_1248_length_9126_cov_5.023928_3_plen_98_part_00